MPVEDHKKLTEELYGSVNPGKPVDESKKLARGYIRKKLIEEYKSKECVMLPPLEEDPAWKMIQNPKHWGIKDASTRIDECLYGS